MSFKHISIEQAHDLLDGDAVFVDIRNPQSYASGHIHGSTALDNSTLQSFVDSTDHTTTLVVVCYHGNSSQQTAHYLVEQGFDEEIFAF